MSDTQLICDDRMHQCHCGLEPGHEGLHECAEPDPQCGGCWGDHDDPGWAWVHRYPGARPGGPKEGMVSDPDEPVAEPRSSHPVFRSPRGGIKFFPPPSLAGLMFVEDEE